MSGEPGRQNGIKTKKAIQQIADKQSCTAAQRFPGSQGVVVQVSQVSLVPLVSQ
jgi:hypothetical protein